MRVKMLISFWNVLLLGNFSQKEFQVSQLALLISEADKGLIEKAFEIEIPSNSWDNNARGILHIHCQF